MKKHREQSLHAILFMLLLCLTTTSLVAQDSMNQSEFITISGVVKDKQTHKRLEYVNISVPGTKIGTVTNQDGEFTIKISKLLRNQNVEISHIGYLNAQVPINTKNPLRQLVWLEPNYTSLDEVIIRGGESRRIVEEAMGKIAQNYVSNGSLLTGFYRETAQKGRRYISISEAIIQIHKTSYADRNVNRDRVQILKGRKLLSQKRSDTLAVKLLGGPTLSIFMDLVKNPDVLLSPEILNLYHFWMDASVLLNERPHYVISFIPRVDMPYALHFGKLYIDKERLSFSRVEFALDMSDKSKATTSILQKKPFGLRFKPLELSFLVTYKELNGVSYLNYIRSEIRFKCDWKRKLFATNYAIVSEMVVTDGERNEQIIPYRDSFKKNQSLTDRVSDFYDPDFWGAYNIIKPSESLENAVHKLKKQHK